MGGVGVDHLDQQMLEAEGPGGTQAFETIDDLEALLIGAVDDERGELAMARDGALDLACGAEVEDAEGPELLTQLRERRRGRSGVGHGRY